MSQSKRLHKTYSKNSTESAIKCVKNEGVSIKQAAQLFEIKRTTLLNPLKNYKC